MNHGELGNNSSHHIEGFARALSAAGHEVVAGMIKSIPVGEFEPWVGGRVAALRTLLRDGPRFPNGRGADILHVWTPRESVRRFAVEFERRHGAAVRLVHLEDPEAVLFERQNGIPVAEAMGSPEKEWPLGGIHPDHHEAFVSGARGMTVVHECLESQLPPGMPWREWVPTVDARFSAKFNGEEAAKRREELGLAPSTAVIGYHGNDHAAVMGDIRTLYQAVDQLVMEGLDVALVRTGRQEEGPSYGGMAFRPGARCIELGYVDREQLPGLMQLADVAVQPGNGDGYNDYRLPAKVPEYLTLGTPLIMGRTSVGRELEAARAAMILDDMTAGPLAAAVKGLLADRASAMEVVERGKRWASERFRVDAAAMEAFYRECLVPGSATSGRAT